MFCSQCGKSVAEDDIFCEFCGNKIIASQSQVETAPLPEALSRPKQVLNSKGTSCQYCGLDAPTKYVEFYQNIGAFVRRFHKSVKGNLCKRCINEVFWRFTLIDLVAGWWGVISFCVTPFYILNNVGRYVMSFGLKSVPISDK